MKVVNRVETESPFVANDWAITLYKDWMETRHAIIKKYSSQIKRCNHMLTYKVGLWRE